MLTETFIYTYTWRNRMPKVSIEWIRYINAKMQLGYTPISMVNPTAINRTNE